VISLLLFSSFQFLLNQISEAGAFANIEMSRMIDNLENMISIYALKI